MGFSKKLEFLYMQFVSVTRVPERFRYVLDIALMVLVIGTVSWLFRRSDPAWLEINPSPWLLIPLLIGFRYGFWDGVRAAAVSAFFSSLLTCIPNVGNLPALLAENAAHYGSYIACAGVAGFARNLFTDTTPQLESEFAFVKEELSRRQAEVSLYQENEIQLKQTLLLHNAEFVSLPDELVKVFQIEDDREAAQEIMELMHHNFGVLSAGMYIESSAGTFSKIAECSGSCGEMPKTISAARNKMMATAVREKKLITCRDLWDYKSPGSKSDYLAVVPVSAGRAYLLVRRMKIASISWNNFGCMEAVLNFWMGGRTNRSRPVGREDFAVAVDRAIALRDNTGMAACVLQFEGNKKSIDRVSKLSIPGYYARMGASLYVLVMDGKKGAKAFGEKATSSIEGGVKYTVKSLDAIRGQ